MRQTVTVTIGRNVGDVPMPADAWRSFHAAVRQTLETADANVWADASYRGQWDGVYEDAALLHASVEDYAVGPIRETLARLAGAYGQDAIGLAVGTAELVEPAAESVPA
jgi:hypothetical protein